MTHSGGTRTLYLYDELVIEAEGRPGAKATAQVGSQTVRMLEVGKGKYRGRYYVKSGDNMNRAAVSVTLTDASGTTTLKADHPVSIRGTVR